LLHHLRPRWIRVSTKISSAANAHHGKRPRDPDRRKTVQSYFIVLSERTLGNWLEGDGKMRRQIAVFLCSAVLGFMMMFSHAIAQQKTVRACQEEWRANKAANQANGVTEKAYVAQCRAGVAPAQTTAAPPAPAAPAPAPTAAPAPAPTAAPAAPAPTPTAAAPPVRPVRPVPPPVTASPVPSTPSTPVPANQFSTEAEAKARCPSDTVVWVNLSSKIYHFSGSKSYGTTRNGAYMCEKETAGEGMRAAKNESHP
jgi:hypothetical protein